MDCSLMTRPSCSKEGGWFFQGSRWSSPSSSRRSSSSSSKYSLQGGLRLRTIVLNSQPG